MTRTAGKVGELKWFWRIRFAKDGRWAARGEVPLLAPFQGTGPRHMFEFLTGTSMDDEFSMMLSAERDWEARMNKRTEACEQFKRIGQELEVTS